MLSEVETCIYQSTHSSTPFRMTLKNDFLEILELSNKYNFNDHQIHL